MAVPHLVCGGTFGFPLPRQDPSESQSWGHTSSGNVFRALSLCSLQSPVCLYQTVVGGGHRGLGLSVYSDNGLSMGKKALPPADCVCP